VPATIHKRRVGESKKGANPLYSLHIPGVNNLFYGLRFARVIYGTWWRERQRAAKPRVGSSPVGARVSDSDSGSEPAEPALPRSAKST
jgi:hypothetical protein